MSTAISIRNVSKKYVIGKQKDGSLRGTLGGMFSKKEHKTEEFWALNDVSFDIQQGDVVGIIGKNGAGKSTLLKILSQITKPTTGSIEINGRVASLLEVGTGFHPELTGRENVYLNGTILGMTRNEVKAKFDEIVAFSGVEKFIDTPVKHYSSGMYVRLAFAVAAHLEPEILIIDEVLAVGDAEFQEKCLGKMKDVAGQGRTVLFVSHHLGSVKKLCNKGVLLEKGLVKKVDDIDTVIRAYLASDSDSSYFSEEKDKSIYIQEVSFLSSETDFDADEPISIKIKLQMPQKTSSEDKILLRLFDENEIVLTSFEKELNKSEYFLTLPATSLRKGTYSWNVILYRPAIEVYDQVHCCKFTVINNNEKYAHLETFDIGKIYSDESCFS